MDYELSDNDILRIAGPDTKILTYPQVMKYKTLKSMFGTTNKVIILYLNDIEGNNYQGHWCIITKDNDKVCFLDSYGLMPDSQLNFNSKAQQKLLGQTQNHLTKLLLNSKLPVEYNEMKFQKKISGVNTCGRHVGLRARFYKVPLKEYQDKFKELRQKGFNLDEVAVQLTYPIIGK